MTNPSQSPGAESVAAPGPMILLPLLIAGLAGGLAGAIWVGWSRREPDLIARTRARLAADPAATGEPAPGDVA